nr:RNA-directed DNA polymerase, eukaryota [Tanacetum cinerariifolium]
MEGLHVAMEDAMAVGLYRGLEINQLNFSHFFFADDVLFIGDWSRVNVKCLVSILECFYRVSGLKINYYKSNLLGVGVPFEDVELLATLTGCNVMASPFCYLGLPIDCNMVLVKSWDPIIDKFSRCLSKWKASLLSIGGRSTLITSVLGAIGGLTVVHLQNSGMTLGLAPRLSKINFLAFTVLPQSKTSCARKHIDNYYLPNGNVATRWSRYLPKNINIFVWRALQDRLPTRWNLSRKGIDIASISCPVCDSGIETMYHTLWTYSLATTIWNRVLNWMELSSPILSNIQGLYGWLDALHTTSNKKDILKVICGVVLWSLWIFRNETIFGTTSPKRCLLFDKIVDCSFRWYSTRHKLSSISWNNWIRNPIEDFSL